jgi:hypothetical protein
MFAEVTTGRILQSHVAERTLQRDVLGRRDNVRIARLILELLYDRSLGYLLSTSRLLHQLFERCGLAHVNSEVELLSGAQS